MARTRSAESPRTRSKTAAIDEIAQGLATFQSILTSIEDFSREGFPYRDGARAKAELQIRETVRRLFGERSPEYQAHRAHKLKISTPAETTQSVHLVKSFITALERKKLELQGLAPISPAPEAGDHPVASGPPQMTLVPPTTPSAQITMAHQSPQGSAPPVTMSVAITTNLSQPTAPAPQTPVLEPSAPVQPPTPAVPPSHLESARFRTIPIDPEPAAPAPVSIPATAAPATRQEPVTPLASPPTAPLYVTAPSQTQVGVFSSPITSPTPAPTAPTSESMQRLPDQPGAPAVSVVAPPPCPSPSPSPTPAWAAVVTSREQPTSDPVDALRKVCLRFHAVARQLRLRKDYRTTLEVEDDYDLQDLLCALLKLEFDEVGADEWTPPYAGGSTRTTLLLNRDRLAVVAKKTRSGLTTKELAEQVAADTAHYASHKPCAHLFCFIYDPEGRIGSPTRLETDLTSVSDSFTVDVLVAPK
ncbi:MAG: hypothetical protein H8J66_07940 [Nitrospira sp.]|nr:hypothetical protein [Nitrospira sp.]